MSRKLSHIRPQGDSANGTVSLAVVHRAHMGQANVVSDIGDGESTMAVIGHASEVPPLSEGDRVVILSLEHGVVVTHRLRSEGERPLGKASRPEGMTVLNID